MGTRLLQPAPGVTPDPVGLPAADTGKLVVAGLRDETSVKTIPSTRASRTWIRVLPALVLLAITLMFVLQNLRTAKVSFATASGALPLAVALLAAAALGASVVLAVGTLRIMQLRKLVRRNRRHDLR
jgi:uncharacterized integral membrane protein